ncbi:MAG: cob(I)yrinic acid a,c-diamide adenosyltransferase [Spirochaetota bacterium]
MTQGLVQIYTGDGKGKTTAAAGLALRAAGRGLSVVFIQFLKCGASGEILLLEKSVPEIKLLHFNSQSAFVWDMNDGQRTLLEKETREGLSAAEEIALRGSCDILILDEIFGACRSGFITADEILKLIHEKSGSVELVLTGRDAPAEIIEAADLVTEMRKVKHPYDRGIKARNGIER